MQIKRNGNILFPNMKTNVVSNNKLLTMVKAKKKDTSATVTISSEGRARIRMLNESTKKDDYMKNAESKIDKILDTIREGGTLSKEEEELVNNELNNMSKQKYKDYRELRLNPEDVMPQLKENYLRREKLFFDMKEQLEANANSQTDNFGVEEIMAYMQEKEYDEKIIEMVREYGEDEDEQGIDENAESKDISNEEANEQELNVNVGEVSVDEIPSEEDYLQKHAMKMIENIDNQMDDVEEASVKAREKEYDFAKQLEDDYERIQQILNSDEVSIEDKVKAYDRFLSDAGCNATSREVQRIKKQFDAETLVIARIMRLGRNGMDDMIKGNLDRGQIGVEFIKSFLV